MASIWRGNKPSHLQRFIRLLLGYSDSDICAFDVPPSALFIDESPSSALQLPDTQPRELPTVAKPNGNLKNIRSSFSDFSDEISPSFSPSSKTTGNPSARSTTSNPSNAPSGHFARIFMSSGPICEMTSIFVEEMGTQRRFEVCRLPRRSRSNRLAQNWLGWVNSDLLK